MNPQSPPYNQHLLSFFCKIGYFAIFDISNIKKNHLAPNFVVRLNQDSLFTRAYQNSQKNKTQKATASAKQLIWTIFGVKSRGY